MESGKLRKKFNNFLLCTRIMLQTMYLYIKFVECPLNIVWNWIKDWDRARMECRALDQCWSGTWSLTFSTSIERRIDKSVDKCVCKMDANIQTMYKLLKMSKILDGAWILVTFIKVHHQTLKYNNFHLEKIHKVLTTFILNT